ncbi:uncharacterized protein LOC125025122 isoform X2 [Penaeus chinensis]|uniref:uncharacterized protein LOC125025122 isoform X2 n=1 Tax=Penaeus chinensis TaxID=139456 RepID=UPI001FB5BAF3|nr:uncharacterized protein LOC125025122 isoform X2 [Penaeus chinensis]
MAFVLLPCDLPTWPTIQRHLGSLKGATAPAQVTQVLHALHSLCNVAIDPDLNEPVPPDVFAGVEKFLDVEVEQDFFSKTLPSMLEAALRLKDLKPPQGLRYSLQQQHDEVTMERALVTSLLAHVFFCTLPRRSLISHPTLSDPCLAPTLSSLNRESQRVKLKALLHYFRKLSDTTPAGTLTFSRKVMSSKEFVTLKDWMKCEAALCPVEIQHEGRLEDTHPPASVGLLHLVGRGSACTHLLQVTVCAMLSYPEMLVSSVFVERLEDNEALQIVGTLKTATVSNLKTRPHVTFRNNTTPPDLIHALMDADDYRQSEVLQYEEINVLRELNKAVLAFTQPIPDAPTSSFSDIISVSRQLSECSGSPPRTYQTPISSGSSLDQNKEDTSLEGNKMKLREKDKGPPREKANQKRGTAVSKELERTKPLKIGKVKKKVEIVEDNQAVKTNTCDIPDSDIVRPSKHNVDHKLKSLLAKEKFRKEKEQVKNAPAEVKRSVAEQDVTGSPPSAGFVTAPTTLKRRHRRKKDVGSKGCDDVMPQDMTAQAERVTFAGVCCSKPLTEDLPNNWEESDEEEEETTRLLNRVMRAIQRLEQERPDLVEEVKQDAQQTLGSKPLPRTVGRPPIPDGRPRPLGERDRREKSQGSDAADRAKRRVGVSGDGRKLSIYVSCSEDNPAESLPDEDHYYSACESLEGAEAPRSRRPSKKRGKKERRKSSFAERLKEALEREPSLDSCQTQENIPNEEDDPLMTISRQESAGFVLDASPRRRLLRKTEKEEEKCGSDISEEDFDDQEEEEVQGKGHEGSDSSHYSFSSDYTSELEDVYEKLGEVLEEFEGGNLGPRTAAIARFAHGLLKRALSESYKDVTLGLDGSAVKDPESGTSGPLPIRSLSFSEPRPPAGKRVRPPTLNTLKNNLGKPIVTGNWGCGSLRGDHQLKAMIQWAAASKARAPKMVYYTYGDQNTVKLDIVCRLLGDRGWRVGDLVSTLLRYSESRLDSWRRSRETELTESADSSLPESLRYRGPSLDSLTLFDELIGADRPFTTMETEL